MTHQTQWLNACTRVLVISGGRITAESPWNMVEDSVTVPILPNDRSAVVHSTEDISDCESDDSLNFFHARLFKEKSEDSLPNMQQMRTLSPSKKFSPSTSLHVVENPASMSHTCDACTVDVHEDVSPPSAEVPARSSGEYDLSFKSCRSTNVDHEILDDLEGVQFQGALTPDDDTASGACKVALEDCGTQYNTSTCVLSIRFCLQVPAGLQWRLWIVCIVLFHAKEQYCRILSLTRINVQAWPAHRSRAYRNRLSTQECHPAVPQSNGHLESCGANYSSHCRSNRTDNVRVVADQMGTKSCYISEGQYRKVARSVLNTCYWYVPCAFVSINCDLKIELAPH